MKKLFVLSFVAIAAVALSSCSKKEKCWELETLGVKSYVWSATKPASIMGIPSVKQVKKTEKECEDANFSSAE